MQINVCWARGEERGPSSGLTREGAGRQESISLQISGESVISVLCQGECAVPITIDFSIKLCSTFPNII